MDRVTKCILMMLMIFTISAVVMTGIPYLNDIGAAYADLSKAKAVGFMGVDYSTNLGNTTGAFGATTLEPGKIPDEINCFFSVQNASGAIVANTATVQIESSYYGADYDVFQIVTVEASTVTGVRNVPAATSAPTGDKWRMNITAIQNANASYVSGQCWFE